MAIDPTENWKKLEEILKNRQRSERPPMYGGVLKEKWNIEQPMLMHPPKVAIHSPIENKYAIPSYRPPNLEPIDGIKNRYKINQSHD